MLPTVKKGRSWEHLKPTDDEDNKLLNFSEKYCLIPLEEIDTFQPGRTYCVISKLLNQYMVHRFSAEKTLFLFGPLHPMRMWAIYLQTDLLVQYVVTVGIIANCAMLTAPTTYKNPSKYAFFGVFLIELLIRCISRGIVLHPYSILRIPWRWLDVISMIGNTVDVLATPGKISIGTSLFRTFRLIHILKTISVIPGLKVVISGLLRSLKMVTDTFFIMLCLMIFFSLLGKMIFEDALTNKCIRDGTDKHNKSNWYIAADHQYQVCGYTTFTNKPTCPKNFTCEMMGTTPYDGLIGFDSIGGAMFTVWRVLTLDNWEEFYRQAVTSKGPNVVIYFALLIFMGSFFLMNLPLAMVISSYAMEVEIAMEEHLKEVTDISYYRNSSEFFYNIENLTVKLYQPLKRSPRFTRRKAAIEQEPSIEPQKSEPRSQFRKLSLTKTNQLCTCQSGQTCKIHQTSINETLQDSYKTNYRTKKAKHRRHRRKSHRRKETRVSLVLTTYRAIIHNIVRRPCFNLLSLTAIIVNSVSLLFIGSQFDPNVETFIIASDKIFRYVFTAEILMKIIGMGRTFFRDINIVDALIVVLNLFLGLQWDIRGISIMRLWIAVSNLERIRFLHHLILLQRVVMNALASLSYLVLLLILTVYIFAVIGFNFFSVRDSNGGVTPSNDDDASTWSFKDFSRSLLIVFRMLCGEWFHSFWECFKSTKKEGTVLCAIFFVSGIICINIVLLNLILGVLLDCFDEANLAEEAEELFRDQTSMLDAMESDMKIVESGMMMQSYQTVRRVLPPWMEKIKAFFDEEISDLILVITLIISCLFQCFEDSNLKGSAFLRIITYIIYVLTSSIFLLEIVLKILIRRMSFNLFRWWNLLEISLSTLFVVDMIVLRNRAVRALRVIRAFRLLQPFTIQRRWRDFLLPAPVLTRSIAAAINVLIIVLYFWYVFGVIGVSLFRDKLYRCKRGEEILEPSVVHDKNECLNKGYNWENNPVNFDHIGKAYLALFQIGTLEGWTEIMRVASQARGVDLQPEKSPKLIFYLYFIVFIIVGVLIALRLFVGVIVQHFDILRMNAESGVTELLINQYLTRYHQAMKCIARRRPLKLAPKPSRYCENLIYNVVTSTIYENCVCVMIISYLTFDVFIYFYNDIYKLREIVLTRVILNYIFLFEVFLELWVFKKLRFQEMANALDCFSVLLCTATNAFASPLDIFIVDPLLLRIFRVIKINRTFLKVKPAKELRRLLLTVYTSLIPISKLGLLLVLVMYVYAVIGMNLFGNSNQMSPVLNFESITPSMMLLFHLSTAAGWNVAFEQAVNKGTCSLNGKCGQYYEATVYFCSYLVICSFVLLNMFVAIVLENFNEIQESKNMAFEEEDLDTVYEMFSKLDPKSTGFISVLYLSDFYSSLPHPFTITKPNKITIMILDIPVCKGIRVHFVDICSALFTFMWGKIGDRAAMSLKKLLEPRFFEVFPERETMTVIGTTKNLKSYERILRRPGEASPKVRGITQSAITIQRAWRYYNNRRKNQARVFKRK